MNEVLQTILARRSVRAFLPDPVVGEDVERIVLAGLYAPSANNHQPWHLTVVTNKALLDDIRDALRSFAISRADVNLMSLDDLFYGAPLVIVVSGEDACPSASSDCGGVGVNLCLAAKELQYGSCIVGLAALALSGEHGRKAKEQLGLPEGFTPCFAVAVGRNAGAEPAPPPRRENAVNYIE